MKRTYTLVAVLAVAISTLMMLRSHRPTGNAQTAVMEELQAQNAPMDLQTLMELPDLEMMPVEGGTFDMGGTEEQQNTSDDEFPVHQVILTDYYIGRYEVTQALWQHVMGENPSQNKQNLRTPVNNVSYADCMQFIEKLNAMTGQNFRLPTEAEWEFAARGGNLRQGFQYSGSNTLGEVGWFRDNSGSALHEVGKKKANELGLHDMSGNAWEWCADWYQSDYNHIGIFNPQGPGGNMGFGRVVRGGGAQNLATMCRVSHRFFCPGYQRNPYVGFRLALSATDKEE